MSLCRQTATYVSSSMEPKDRTGLWRTRIPPSIHLRVFEVVERKTGADIMNDVAWVATGKDVEEVTSKLEACAILLQGRRPGEGQHQLAGHQTRPQYQLSAGSRPWSRMTGARFLGWSRSGARVQLSPIEGSEPSIPREEYCHRLEHCIPVKSSR